MMRSVVDIFFDTYFFFEAANSLQTREAEAEDSILPSSGEQLALD